MKKLILTLAIVGLAAFSATSIQAQGYQCNYGGLYGNGGVQQPCPYSTPAPAYGQQVVNQNQIVGHGNQVTNVNQGNTGSVYNQNMIQGNGNKVVNVSQSNYPPANFSAPPLAGFTPQTTNFNNIQGNNNSIVNAVQQGVANGLPAYPGQGPVNINVNINVNTIIGDNNQIINQARR